MHCETSKNCPALLPQGYQIRPKEEGPEFWREGVIAMDKIPPETG